MVSLGLLWDPKGSCGGGGRQRSAVQGQVWVKMDIWVLRTVGFKWVMCPQRTWATSGDICGCHIGGAPGIARDAHALHSEVPRRPTHRE